MGYISLFLISVGLCFDTFAISVSCGLLKKGIRFSQTLRLACIFALVQGAMPLIGWLVGRSIEPLIASYDHWIAFALLAIIGGKMIYESFKPSEEACDTCRNSMDLKTAFGMAIATSIDALFVGVGMAFVKLDELKLIALIAMIVLVTGVLTILGVWVGKRFGHRLEKQSSFIGGLILVLIGLKVLLEHTVFA